MTDLIERSEIFPALQSAGVPYNYATQRVLKQIPAVDAVEVVHGEWVEDGCMTVCSECHERKEFPHWICCPACGARMDGRGDLPPKEE